MHKNSLNTCKNNKTTSTYHYRTVHAKTVQEPRIIPEFPNSTHDNISASVLVSLS